MALLLTLIYLTIFLHGSYSAENIIHGKVLHTGIGKLTPGAKLEVAIKDTSLQDTAAKLLSNITIDVHKFPTSFFVKYNPTQVKQGHTYTVSATIKDRNQKLLFLNDVRIPVTLTGFNPTKNIDIPVIQVGGNSQSSGVKPGVVPTKSGCPPVKNCKKKCAYGFEKKNECDICKCHDPCNPGGKSRLCGAGKKCVIDKSSVFGGATKFLAHCEEPKSFGNDKNTKAICKEPKVTGICRAAMPRFFYNPSTRTCEQFTYGGCGGNKNNFTTRKLCEDTCKA